MILHTQIAEGNATSYLTGCILSWPVPENLAE